MAFKDQSRPSVVSPNTSATPETLIPQGQQREELGNAYHELLIRYDELWDEANALRNGLTFETLRLKNVERNLKVFEGTSWSPTDWATAVAGEVGEACNFIKKRRRGEEVATNDIGKELADAVIYLDLLAWNLGLDLGKAVTDKFNEVSERRGTTIRIEPTLQPVASTKLKARRIS